MSSADRWAIGLTSLRCSVVTWRSSVSMVQGPAAAEMQVWMGMVSPGSAVVIWPSRRSRTAPSRRLSTQLKQMPIRQPDGISTPGAPRRSPAAARRRRTRRPSASGRRSPCRRRRRRRSRWAGSARCAAGRPGPSSAQWVSRSSSISFGPQAQVSPLGQVGHQLGQLGRLEPPVGAGVPLDQPDPAVPRRAPAARRRKPRPRGYGAECTTTTSASSCSALRSMPMTGVMPLPAVTNRTFAGRGAAAA